MKKFLKDEPYEIQQISNDILPLKIPPESNKFLVLWKNNNQSNWSYQIVIQEIPALENNYYKILIFDDDSNLFLSCLYHSHVMIPPVADRLYKGAIEYVDYIKVQEAINYLAYQYNFPSFEIDCNPKYKFFNTVPDPKEAIEKAKKREQYNILSVFAEKAPEWRENANNLSVDFNKAILDIKFGKF